MPSQPPFDNVSGTLWSAYLTVNAPGVIYFPPGGVVVRGATFDDCCTYTYDFGSATDGRFVLSYAQVPEPASWALMIGGFPLAGGAMRRRTRASISIG